jgi:phage-related holin
MMSEGHESNHLKELNDNRLDQIFDEEKLTEAIKKGKRKSTKKTVFISVATAVCVFILINICNIILTVNLSNQAYERTNAYIKITVPNGYISKAVDTISF